MVPPAALKPPPPMITRRPCPPAPGPLEDYAQQFDLLLASLAQRRGLRGYLQGLLLPRDRNKTLTGLAGAEPITGAQHREVQRLQWFLSESAWITSRSIGGGSRCSRPTQPLHRTHGALVIDDNGDRKDGTATAHVARQYLGSLGKIDNGIVAVTSLWADPRCYWPLHVVPYTPASRLPDEERGPGFRTKPQLAVELVQAAQQAGVPSRQWWPTAPMATARVSRRRWAPPGAVRAGAQAPQGHLSTRRPGAHSERGRRRAWLAWPQPTWPVAAGDPPLPQRSHRDLVGGRRSAWRLGSGPATAAVVTTTDPARLPGSSTWYLLTDLPRPAGRRAQQAQLAEIVGLYGLRNWVKQGYKQVKGELGWADFQVRGDRAIRRHWTLVCCAFSFCWHAGQAEAAPAVALAPPATTAKSAAAGQAPTRGPCNVSILTDAEAGRGCPGPGALRRVRGWLIPAVWLQRCWRGWSTSAPPPPLQQALDWVRSGRPIYLYLPPYQQTTVRPDHHCATAGSPRWR